MSKRLSDDDFLKSISHLMDQHKQTQITRRNQETFLDELSEKQTPSREVKLKDAIEEIKKLQELDLPVNGWETGCK